MSATTTSQRPDPAEFFPGKPYLSASDLAKFFSISRAAAYRLEVEWSQVGGLKRASVEAVRRFQKKIEGA